MSKTILANVSGFTPIIDSIVQELDVQAAVVFGSMWRYCQMKDGVCNASVDKIAKRGGVSSRTVTRRIKDLLEKGYLVDKTPGLKGKPHTYADTGKANFSITIGSQPMTESHSTYDRESQVDTKPMTESQLKKQVKESKRVPPNGGKNGSSPKPTKSRGNPLLHSIAVSLSEVCKMDYGANQGRLFKEAKLLLKAEPQPTPELIATHYGPAGTWYERDFRGKKGSLPHPSTIRQTWTQYAVETQKDKRSYTV